MVRSPPLTCFSLSSSARVCVDFTVASRPSPQTTRPISPGRLTAVAPRVVPSNERSGPAWEQPLQKCKESGGDRSQTVPRDELHSIPLEFEFTRRRRFFSRQNMPAHLQSAAIGGPARRMPRPREPPHLLHILDKNHPHLYTIQAPQNDPISTNRTPGSATEKTAPPGPVPEKPLSLPAIPTGPGLAQGLLHSTGRAKCASAARKRKEHGSP